MDDAVIVPLEAGAHIHFRGSLLPGATGTLVGKGGKRIEPAVLLVFQFFSNGHGAASYVMGNARYSCPVSIPSTVPEVISVSRSKKG